MFVLQIIKSYIEYGWPVISICFLDHPLISGSLLHRAAQRQHFGNTSFSILMDEKEICANKEVVGMIRIVQQCFSKYNIILKTGNYVSWCFRKTNKNWKSFSHQNILNVFQLSWRLKWARPDLKIIKISIYKGLNIQKDND